MVGLVVQVTVSSLERQKTNDNFEQKNLLRHMLNLMQ